MTDQEKIELLTSTVARLRKHVGLFLKAEIDDVLQKVKEGSQEQGRLKECLHHNGRHLQGSSWLCEDCRMVISLKDFNLNY